MSGIIVLKKKDFYKEVLQISDSSNLEEPYEGRTYMPNVADYQKGTHGINEIDTSEAIMIREKNGYQLWILGEFASIIKDNEKPEYKRSIAGALIYDWNALTGDNLDSIE